MRTGIKVGDVLSEISHYIVAGLNFDSSSTIEELRLIADKVEQKLIGHDNNN